MKTILTFLALVVSFALFGQTAEQREVIKALMNQEDLAKSAIQIERYTNEREKRIADYLEANPEANRSFTKDGRPYLLYNVLPDGTPIFITTKDKAQQTNTKAVSLYTGGSIGVNITGTNMVAGVWDGGQVRADHETLIGRVAMQAGQTVDDGLNGGGNAHQTAVTGIIVAKLDNNAQGIAHNATTMNYDWDDDLNEMNAFATSGYLISNHSYGYGNGPGTDLWLFGAYDQTAWAWDALLKTKPNYLPFIAGGNEQETSGNPGAGGYDIITGSSAAKNPVTVGSVNSDNAMSDYSNWGPTDDGRIKPDIVTLGTAIDVPLYNDNTGYTGNVPESSGTSYSAPAAAAGALLLQQYYHSLNNEYMTAAMLKALLLHSADDDASNNGPDAKFGWGILNLENAANIIKQSNLPNGTAKMIVISTNPTNDGLNEIINNFTFDAGNARVSLCWVDDEGPEQTEAHGVNPTASRMVYNFSMKFEQTDPALTAWPYNNLDVANPATPAVAGSDWFQSANNYIQANLTGTTSGASGKVSIRKSTTSPAAVRQLALIVTGLKASTESTWTGAVNNDWHTAGNWTGSGVPGAATDVTIPAGLTNYPTLSAAGAVNNILLGSSAAGTASLLDNGHLTVNGQATIQRYIIGGGYHNVSIPIDGGATAAAFMHSYLRKFNAVGQEWVNITEPTDALADDEGYMIWYTGTNTTYEFAGNLISGAYTAATPSGASPNVDNQRYNLVPNPYPSAIDWDANPGWTRTNLQGAFYIWNRGAGGGVNGQWASFVTGSGGTHGASRYIPVGQSFFVGATTGGNPVLAMNNGVRVHNDQAFLKEKEVIADLLRMQVQTAEGNDEAIVQLRENATDNFDGQFDARKLYGSLALPQLYTLSSDNQMLSINALSVNDETTIIPLAVEWSQSGEITLSFSNLESFASSAAIFLEDLLTEEMMDVSEQPAYTFNYTEGDEPVRFRIHFMGVTSLDDLATAATHQIWSRNDNIYLSLPDHSGQTARIELFDLLGNKLMETSLKLENPSILRSPATGIVIVRITAGNEVFTNKLFIR